MKLGPPGPKKRTNACSPLLNSTETMPGGQSLHNSRVIAILCRPQPQATEGPLPELPQARPAQVRVDPRGRPVVDQAHQPAWQKLETGGGRTAGKEQEPD